MGSLLQIVYNALRQKPGGDDVCKEYNRTKGLSDSTRKKLVNILVADMIESHGLVFVMFSTFYTCSCFSKLNVKLDVISICCGVGGSLQLMSALPMLWELSLSSPI